jgi:hypothetical protein
MNESLEKQDAPVFSYALASGDLRYIEIGEREIFLRRVPGKGLVFRGEIAGHGSDSYINLSEILLEYAMSCEGCSRAELATEMLLHFGDQLGQIYLENTNQENETLSEEEKLSRAMVCLLTSMDAKYSEEHQSQSLEYSLDCCPLSECARDTGLNRSVEMAYLSLVELFNSIIAKLAPEWTLIKPSAVELNIPLHNILITR